MKRDIVALVDFGSTFTKLSLVELETGSLLATAQKPTTIDTDVVEGYRHALEAACSELSIDSGAITPLAASSAGGGLSVAAIGLVDDYTATAARQAALNAGAKVELILTGRLDATGIGEIHKLNPDIVLFAGGTNGGQTQQVIDNARVLSKSQFGVPIILACNNDIAEQVAEIVGTAFTSVVITENVLPEITTMNIEPARSAMSRIFVEQVIVGKGLSQSTEFCHSIILPTPQAVLIAVDLLSKGTPYSKGVGSVAAVDLGGATTDVHSSLNTTGIARGITVSGLNYPPLTRSVQGDLGMRWSAKSAFDADRAWFAETSRAYRLSEKEIETACFKRQTDPCFLPTDELDEKIDELLAISCTALSIERHCGTARAVYIPNQGLDLIQEGVNLRDLPLLIGTGGMLIYSQTGRATLEAALGRQPKESLSPLSPEVVIDNKYILASAGILSTLDVQAAFNLMHAHLVTGMSAT